MFAPSGKRALSFLNLHQDFYIYAVNIGINSYYAEHLYLRNKNRQANVLERFNIQANFY